ncbi:MAG: hypothetical protein QOJ39_3833 [Candidatus Eremiobacteraeota bacterium]|jgi:hypothetical protein|nr:hypothetical protein [Candidatus Eremiobacteraeota bacterium]
MAVRIRSLVGVLAASCALAACGGGGGGGGGGSFTPTPPANPAITVSPSSLNFSGGGSAAQTFTVSSNVSGLPAPAIDPIGCAPVATFATASTSLPATYTVTPQGNGSCAVVVRVGSQAATLGVTVGGASGASISASTNAITVFVGGTSGSVTVTASSGTLTPDATACANIAAIGGSGGASPQTFTIAPLGVGSCTLAVVDGASSVLVPITVNANPNGGNALFITPSTLDFASPAASPQQANLTFSGNAGQVSINETDCTGGAGGTSKPKIAFLTLTGVPPGSPVSLPQNVTVTPYGSASGSCSIFFTSSTGASQAVLNVIVH